ncbi:thymidine phosphorylase [Clostridium cibarium]|uniref:Pyrimidine-nucleoside phosphorylase n=1 Tax=Clostridium cibarium TaxID=2762247 RepID=A0ABR8PY31_9CLOT|nr:thymidine phosphorylase [Clostridium cibarium]MBD7913067.1 thymidine phosphorylase [Clostridium cibarium]
MNIIDCINKKKNSEEMSNEEISYVVQKYTLGEIPDYQFAAWLMAVYFNGMSTREITQLTYEMAQSGERFDLSTINGITVDKHSTGGVGDKTSLVVCPIIASLGLNVIKISGKALDYCGGTIDKLKSIKEMKVTIPSAAVIDQIKECGISIISQSESLVPADKKIYELRDLTATVNSIPLIASSIMSKKIATGADIIILDVKVGSGAFMKTIDDAVLLAQTMVSIGEGLGKKTIAVVSNMNTPLGKNIGNILEIGEVIETLKGNGPSDLVELCSLFGAIIAFINKRAISIEEGKLLIKEKIQKGEVLEKFNEFIKRQGGNLDLLQHDLELLKTSRRVKIYSNEEGYINKIDSFKIGNASMLLAGRRNLKESQINYSTGILLNKKEGDFVNKGELILELVTDDTESEEFREAYQLAHEATVIEKNRKVTDELIKAIVIKEKVFFNLKDFNNLESYLY